MSVLFSKTIRAGLAATALTLAIGCGDDKVSKMPPKQEFPQSVTRDVAPKTQITPIADEPVASVPMELPKELKPVRPTPETYSQFMQEGRILMTEGNYGAAVDNFAKAAEKKPNLAAPRMQMARALLASGNHAEARVHAEAAIEIDSSLSDVWNTMGRVELAEGDREAAIASFQRAVDADEDNSYAWNNLGYVLIEVERYEEAVQALENATSGGKPTHYMWNNLGMAYEHLDMLAEARASYRQAVDGGSPKAQANLDRLEGVVSLKRSEEVLDGGVVEPEVKDEALEVDDKVEGELPAEPQS